MSKSIVLKREIGEKRNSIESIVEDLNNYADNANSATSRSSFNKYKNLYDDSKVEYDNLIEEYNTTTDEYERFINYEQSTVIKYDIPNMKDDMQHQPANFFYENKFAGGILWSALEPKGPDDKVKNDFSTTLRNGNIFSYLNSGYTEIKSTLKGFGFLDLLNTYRDSKVVTYNVKVSVGNTELINENVDLNLGGINDSDGQGFNDTSLVSVGTNKNSMSLTEVSDMMSMQDDKAMATDMLKSLGLNPLGAVMAVTVTDIATGKVAQAQARVAQFTVNQTINMLSKAVTSRAVSAFGITSAVPATGLLGAITATFAEVVEMAMGLDNSFGYGGGFMSEASGAAGYKNKSFSDNFMDDLKSTFGMDFVSTNTITNYDGDTIGNWTSFSMGDFSVTVENYNNGTSFISGSNEFGDFSYNPGDYDIESELDDITSGGWDSHSNNNSGWDTGDGTDSNGDGFTGDGSGPTGGYGDGNGGFGGP